MKTRQMLLAAVLTGILLITSACAPEPSPAPAPEPDTTPVTEPAPAPEPTAFKDGTYRAELPDFDPNNGWKDSVEITVASGEITEVIWNGTHKDGGDDKKTASMNGAYPMVEQGRAKAPWHEQAALAEAFLIQTQDPAAVTYTDDDGHTDAISGATIAVKEFFELASEALESAK